MTRPNFLRFPVWHIVFAAHIKLVLLAFMTGAIAALCLFGAYWGGDYIVARYSELMMLRQDNAQAMAILSGARYVVDGVEYRVEEVKQLKLIGGL